MIATVLVHMTGLMLRKLEELERWIVPRYIHGVLMFAKLVNPTAVLYGRSQPIQDGKGSKQAV